MSFASALKSSTRYAHRWDQCIQTTYCTPRLCNDAGVLEPSLSQGASEAAGVAGRGWEREHLPHGLGKSMVRLRRERATLGFGTSFPSPAPEPPFLCVGTFSRTGVQGDIASSWGVTSVQAADAGNTTANCSFLGIFHLNQKRRRAAEGTEINLHVTIALVWRVRACTCVCRAAPAHSLRTSTCYFLAAFYSPLKRLQKELDGNKVFPVSQDLCKMFAICRMHQMSC